MSRRTALNLSLIVACAVSVALMAGCGERRAHRTVMVRGGPSLLRVLDDVAKEFERQNPGVSIVMDFSCPPCVLPSSASGGGQMDVLVSVGDMDIRHLEGSGMIEPGEQVQFGQAQLLLIAPVRGRSEVKALGDLLTRSVHKIGIGDPEKTDLGHYTVLALQRGGVYEELTGKFAIAKSGCDLLRSVALLQNDAAFVYDFCITLDQSSAKSVQTLPERLYEPIPMLAVADRRSSAFTEAQEFVTFLGSEAARPLLERKGVHAAK